MYPITAVLAISTSELWEEVHSCLQQLPVRVVHEQAGVDDPAAFLDRIERTAPDVVLLDLLNCADVLPEMIRGIRATSSQPDVVALHVSSDPDAILNAIRAGAREYIYPPCSPSLQNALDRLSTERHKMAEKIRPGGRTFGLVSAKGGCGATTLACHAAAEIYRRTSQDTLVIDLDLSAGLVRTLFKTKSRYSILEACSNVNRLDKSFWRALVADGNHGLEVMGGPLEVAVKEAPSASQVRHVLRFVRSQYEWILVDLGRGFSPTLAGALDELDELLLVTTTEVPALQQAKRMIQYLRDRGMSQRSIKLVLNRVVRRPEVSIPELETMLGVAVFAVIGNDYWALYEAYAEGKLLAPDTHLCGQIGGMMAKLAGLEQAPKKRAFSFFS